VIETTAPTTATKNERKERKKEERKRKIITRYSRITLHIVRTAYEQAQDMGVPMGGWGSQGVGLLCSKYMHHFSNLLLEPTGRRGG
jgi:hypothetical protein